MVIMQKNLLEFCLAYVLGYGQVHVMTVIFLTNKPTSAFGIVPNAIKHVDP